MNWSFPVPFLLTVDHKGDGTTHIQYDDGPTRRVQVVALTAYAHETLAVPARDLLAYTLADERPPVNRRNLR
jgi:hypothetical protein